MEDLLATILIVLKWLSFDSADSQDLTSATCSMETTTLCFKVKILDKNYLHFFFMLVKNEIASVLSLKNKKCISLIFLLF